MNMLPSTITPSSAKLPASYENAKTALANCVSLDECMTWGDKMEALASYAKQSKDDELMKMATRIRDRAIRRAGELLKQIDGTGNNQHGVGTHTNLSQREVAEQAGMSKHQQVQAVRVANVPAEDFERQVESEKPPTVTKLAQQGTKPAPRAVVDLNRLVEDGVLPGLEDAVDEFGGIEEQDPTEEELAAAAATQAANSNNVTRMQQAANDAAPRTLYVRRDVLNRADIVKWAEGQGFTDIVPDLHVTIAYSREPVDWFAVGESWSPKLEISAGGPRQMEALGDDGKYKALLITASELRWRHAEIVERGASWDWPEYQPHISIQIGGDIDLSKVDPYQGKIILGPEIFEELRED